MQQNSHKYSDYPWNKVILKLDLNSISECYVTMKHEMSDPNCPHHRDPTGNESADGLDCIRAFQTKEIAKAFRRRILPQVSVCIGAVGCASDSDVSRNLTPDAYEENYEFADPVGSFKGLTPLHEEQFYRNTFHPDRSLNELNKSMLELEDERSYISMRLK
ncbi:hypothetical protein LINPERPRIM_LOCUS29029 [Linum perenne]